MFSIIFRSSTCLLAGQACDGYELLDPNPLNLVYRYFIAAPIIELHCLLTSGGSAPFFTGGGPLNKIIPFDLGGGVIGENLKQGNMKNSPEFIHPIVSGAELALECRPCNEFGPAMQDSVQPLCQPGVDDRSQTTEPRTAPQRRNQRSGRPGYLRADRLSALGRYCARLPCHTGTQDRMFAFGTGSKGLPS